MGQGTTQPKSSGLAYGGFVVCLKGAATSADTSFMGGVGAAGALDVAGDSSIRARALGLLYVAGGTIGVVSMVLPHGADASEVGLWSNIGLAYVAGGLLLGVGARVPGWAFHVFVALGSAMVMRAVLVSGDANSFYSVWFLWIGLYAFYFFRRPAAAAHVALVASLYALTWIVHTPGSPVAHWLTTVATVVIAGLFIDTLVRRARMQARYAAESAQLVATVAEVAHELARVSDSEGARNGLCAAAARLARADTVALWEPGTTGASLELTGVAGPRPSQRSLPFVAAPGGAVQAFTNGQTVHDAEDVGVPEYTGEPQPPQGALWQPVTRDSVPVAVLAFYWRVPSGNHATTLTLAGLLATEAAVTL